MSIRLFGLSLFLTLELFFQEELEAGGQTSIYDHYKFLTEEELKRLNLSALIGTNLLRAYMHGYFVNYGLYKKVGCP